MVEGVGDFWDANSITYLSGKRITIRPVALENNKIVPFRWMTSRNWYDAEHTKNFTYILVKDEISVTRPDINRDSIQAYLALHPPEKRVSYGNYAIYVYDNGTMMN